MEGKKCVHAVMPGSLAEEYRQQMKLLIERDLVRRFWARDMTLWPADSEAVRIPKERLNWLDVPNELEGYAKRATRVTPALKQQFESLILVAMGSSNLAAEILAPKIEASLERPFFLVDSLSPEDLRELEEKTDIRRSLFLTVSKTGKPIETHVLLLYFLQRLKELGIERPGSHFIAVTEENSYLARLAGEYQFLHTFLDPPGFPGRYSGVIHFTLLLSALCGSDAGELLKNLKAMREECGPERAGETNGAAGMAALLAACAANGHWRMAILASERRSALTKRLGQLIGTSTCKFGFGIVPLPGVRTEVLGKAAHDWMAATVELSAESDAIAEMIPSAVPRIATRIEKEENLCEEIFRWEIATCMACALLEVNPFSEPDVEEVHHRATGKLNGYGESGRTNRGSPRIEEEEVELYAEGNTRFEISMLSATEALRTFFEGIAGDGYLAVLSFLPRVSSEAMLTKLRDRLEEELGVPVLINHGPRYLRIAGQCFKGGPAKGHFLMLTGESQEDIEVPGAEYTFGELALALAEADFQVLDERGRPAVRLHVKRGAARGIGGLEALMERGLVGIRRGKR